MKGGAFCFFHEPSMIEKRAAANLHGGKLRAQERERRAPKDRIDPHAADYPLANEKDALRILEQTVNQLRRGEIGGSTAHAVGYLTGIALKAFSQGDTDHRLQDLEEQLRPLKGLNAEQLLALVRMAPDETSEPPTDEH